MLVWNYDRESYDATYNENLVNKMFIGHMKIGGAEALAGLGLYFPVITWYVIIGSKYSGCDLRCSSRLLLGML